MFSFRRGSVNFIKGNIALITISALLLINAGHYGKNAIGFWVVFLFVAEMFLLLWALASGWENGQEGEFVRSNVFTKAGLLKGIWGLLLFVGALGFISLRTNSSQEGVPFPASISLWFLTINALWASASIVAPKTMLRFYWATVYEEHSKTFWTETFRYLTLYFGLLNTEVHLKILHLPFFLHRLLAILFVISLTICTFTMLTIF